MANLTEEYQYDENGVLTKKVSKNFRGMTEEYEYKNDEHGNPIEIRYTEKSTTRYHTPPPKPTPMNTARRK